MKLGQAVGNAKGLRHAAVKALLEEGRVTVNGTVVTDETFQFVIGAEEVAIDGVPLKTPFQRVLLLNKPQQCVCSVERGSETWRLSRGIASVDAMTPEQRSTAADATATAGGYGSQRGATGSKVSVMDLVPEALRHSHLGVVGRLDQDTTGALLLCTDGGLQALLAHPSSSLEKQYLATLNKEFPLDASAEEKFSEGMELGQGLKCRPARMQRLESAQVRIWLHEGANHQVKRMVGMCGGGVEALHREAVGQFTVEDLALGDCREVTVEELQTLAAALPMACRSAAAREGVARPSAAKKKRSG